MYEQIFEHVRKVCKGVCGDWLHQFHSTCGWQLYGVMIRLQGLNENHIASICVDASTEYVFKIPPTPDTITAAD